MFENYAVSVKISLVNHVTAGLLLLTKQFASTDAAAAKLQQRMNGIQNMAKGGAYLLGGGMALAAPFIFAIDKAAELQKQMIAIQLATRGTTGEMDRMRAAVEGIASQTVFSNIDVAKMGKLLATGTGLGAGGVTSLLPVAGKFADVQMLMKGTPYEQSTNTLVRLAHIAGHYDAPSLSKYADLLTKASLIVPGGLGEVAHALQYSQGVAKNALGVDDEQAVLATALLNRLGLKGSRGGSNLIAAMTRTIPGIFGSGLLTGKSNEALLSMGMIDGKGHAKVFKDGKFDIVTWMGLMGEYVNREFAGHPEAIARQDIMKNFQHAYGVQGSRVATLFSTPQAIEQFRQIGQSFNEAGGVEGMQKRFADESVAQQWMNAKTNFMSAMTEMGMTLLPMATKALKALNLELGKVIEWISKHQHATKVLAQSFLTLAGVMAFSGTVLLLTSAFKGLALVAGGFGVISTALSWITVALTTFTAAYAATRWVADKVTPKDWTLGGQIYDWTHPAYNPNGGSRVASAKGTINRGNVYLDKRKVGEIISGEQSKALKAPQTGSSSFDSSMGLIPAGGL